MKMHHTVLNMYLNDGKSNLHSKNVLRGASTMHTLESHEGPNLSVGANIHKVLGVLSLSLTYEMLSTDSPVHMPAFDRLGLRSSVHVLSFPRTVLTCNKDLC